MEIISRAEAKERGLSRYYTGKFCKKGHKAKRRTHNGECCECARLYSKKYEDQNKESRKARCRQRARADRENRLEYNRVWRKKNPEKMVEIAKRSYKKNKHKIDARRDIWVKNNKEKVRAYKRNRKARVKRAEGRHSASDVEALLAWQRRKCAGCLADTRKTGYHVDHITPLAAGGTNWPDNLQILCPACNLSKGAKDPIQWASQNGRLL